MPENRQTRGRRTREAILQAAIELLGRNGPGGFTAAALAREAGVSKATLFHHFGSLDAIPLAAFDFLGQGSLGPASSGDLPLRAYLRALGAGTLEMARDRQDFLRAYFVYFTKALFEPRLRERLLAGTEELHAAMKEGLAAKLPGARSPAEIEALARLVELALDGLGLHALVLGRAPEQEAAWDLFAELLGALEEEG